MKLPATYTEMGLICKAIANKSLDVFSRLANTPFDEEEQYSLTFLNLASITPDQMCKILTILMLIEREHGCLDTNKVIKYDLDPKKVASVNYYSDCLNNGIFHDEEDKFGGQIINFEVDFRSLNAAITDKIQQARADRLSAVAVRKTSRGWAEAVKGSDLLQRLFFQKYSQFMKDDLLTWFNKNFEVAKQLVYVHQKMLCEREKKHLEQEMKGMEIAFE
jgi:hypothetical protein